MSPRFAAVSLIWLLCGACIFDGSGVDPSDAVVVHGEQGAADIGDAATDGPLADRPGDRDLPGSTDHPVVDHGLEAAIDGPPGDTVPPSWWDPAWKRRRRITFDNSQQASALKDFPVLIVLDAGRIDYSATKQGGADLRFVDADNSQQLAHEIEEWNAAGSSYVWVKVPQIDGGSSTDHIWIYHGNGGAADAQQVAAVWSNGYQAVWHLNDDFNDSTAQACHASNVSSTDTPGRIADGQAFDGVDQYIDTNYTQNPSIWTVSAWVRGSAAPVATSGTKNAISGPLMKEETFQLTWDHHDPYFRGAASLKTTNSGWKGAPFGALKAQTWYWLAATYDGAALRAYQDGAYTSQVAASGNPVAQSDSAKIGRHCFRTDVHPFLDGKVDEVRIAHVVRTDDWIAAQHLSMTDAFVTFGTEEKLP